MIFENGKLIEQSENFVVHFNAFCESKFRAIRVALDDKWGGDDVAKDRPLADSLERTADLFEQLVSGWDDVLDENGSLIEYSSLNLRELITGQDGPAVSTGMYQALAAIRFGPAAEKNS